MFPMIQQQNLKLFLHLGAILDRISIQKWSNSKSKEETMGSILKRLNVGFLQLISLYVYLCFLEYDWSIQVF